MIHEAKAAGRDIDSVREILRKCKIDDKTSERTFSTSERRNIVLFEMLSWAAHWISLTRV